MISNEQMEKLWWQYKNEGVAKNILMQVFCSMHNVPYSAFEKYLKLHRHFSDVHHITVTDLPEPVAAEVPLAWSEAEDRILAEKDSTIAENEARTEALEKELAESKAANVDARHKVESVNQEKFWGISKKGIDRKHQTQKGRDDNEDDFDGTYGSVAPITRNYSLPQSISML